MILVAFLITVEPPNKGHFGDDIHSPDVFLVKGFSSLGGSKCIVGITYTGTVSPVPCREVYHTASLFGRVPYRRFYLISNLGQDFFISPLFIRAFCFLLQLAVWDTAGVERFRTLTRNYYRNADATVFVYSVTDTASLHYLTQWLKDAQSHAPDALRVIVGNKIDLKGSIEVEESVAQAFADLQKIKSVYRISCKTNEGVDNFITELTREIHRRSQDGADVHIDEDALRVGPKTPAQDQQPGEGGGCRC